MISVILLQLECQLSVMNYIHPCNTPSYIELLCMVLYVFTVLATY